MGTKGEDMADRLADDPEVNEVDIRCGSGWENLKRERMLLEY